MPESVVQRARCACSQLLATSRKYGVDCWCGIRGPLCDTEAEAIAAWNTRPATPAQELADALENLSAVLADHHTAAAAIAYNAVMGHFAQRR